MVARVARERELELEANAAAANVGQLSVNRSILGNSKKKLRR